jgi:hypothetical protein
LAAKLAAPVLMYRFLPKRTLSLEGSKFMALMADSGFGTPDGAESASAYYSSQLLPAALQLGADNSFKPKPPGGQA